MFVVFSEVIKGVNSVCGRQPVTCFNITFDLLLSYSTTKVNSELECDYLINIHTYI